MTAMLVSALVNAAIISTGATAILWLVLRIVPRSAVNAATRYGLWWVALLVAAALPIVFVPSLHLRIPRPPSLGALPVHDLAAIPEQTPQGPSGPDADSLVRPHSPASTRGAIQQSAPHQKTNRWSRFYSQWNVFPLRVVF